MTPTRLLAISMAVFFGVEATSRAAHLPPIAVHSEGHYLQTSDGRPFFWLGDTAWELIHGTTPEESSYYLATRARQGFTVIQTVVLAEMNGVRKPTPLGQCPFVENDPARPNETYFDRVAALVDEAEARGLYVALLPTWGDKLTAPWGDGPRLFTLDNLPVARGYGRYLGGKLKGRTNVVWMLGGDRPAKLDPTRPDEWPTKQGVASGFPANQDWRPIWREIATGIGEGSGTKPVFLYHPAGGAQTSAELDGEDWLSINGMQSGHGSGHDVPVWEWIAHDYLHTPTKPTLDLEPNYEDHPVNPWPRWDPALGYFRDYDVRKQTYRSVLAGACGVTYGHHAIWGFVGARNDVINHADRDWIDAMHRPGGRQMLFLRQLIESRPFFTRIPDDSLVSNPAPGRAEHMEVSRDREGTYAFIYFPNAAQRVTIHVEKLRGPQLRAWWYDPRTGFAHPVSEPVENKNPREFESPQYGPDWVLVLDNLDANYAAPGQALPPSRS